MQETLPLKPKSCLLICTIILSFQAQRGFILYYTITPEFYHLLEYNDPPQNEGGPGAFHRFHGIVQCQHSGTFSSFPGS